MRDLPDAKLTKAPADYVPSYRHSYDVVGTGTGNEGRELGHVIRELGPGSQNDQRPWKGYVLATAGEYGSGLHVVKDSPFRTRQEALIAVLQAWQAQEDELKAYEIVEGIAYAINLAEKDAAQQLAVNPQGRLIPVLFRTKPFSVSSRVIEADLITERHDLRNRLAGLKPITRYYLQHNAYMIRMRELEIERRQGAQKDAGFEVASENRCQAFAHQGVSSGMCDTVLDQHGNCRYADNHVEEN